MSNEIPTTFTYFLKLYTIVVTLRTCLKEICGKCIHEILTTSCSSVFRAREFTSQLREWNHYNTSMHHRHSYELRSASNSSIWTETNATLSSYVD